MSKPPPRGLAFLVGERPVEALEQLDAPLRIVTRPGWLALAALFFTLASFTIFACMYRVPLKIDGRGIILSKSATTGDSLMQITAPGAGRLKRVYVEIGSPVTVGDLLAEIDREDLRDAIRAAEADLARQTQEHADLLRFEAAEAATKAAALEKIERTLQRNLVLDESRLSSHRKIASADRGLNARHMLGNSDALKSQADADAVESAIGGTNAKLHELAFTRAEDQIERDRERLRRILAIRNSEAKLALLREQYTRESRIVSPYVGNVVDLMLAPQAPIEKGAPAAILRPRYEATPAMEAIVFVPAGRGKTIRAGDTVEISPDTTRREEHGYIRATVRSVSEIPATEQAMLAELKHKDLVVSFVEQQREKVLLSIHAELHKRPASTFRGGDAPLNHLVWSSQSGARQRLSTGTLCSASIVVERRPLATLAVPWLKLLTGMD
jgi:HlyD family secretion protein